jgi:hypothetical protein
MITQRQIKAIHALKNKVKMSDDLYRHFLQSNYGVSSSKNLSYENAKSAIDNMVTLAYQMGIIQPNDPPGMATKKQQAMLIGLWKKVSNAPDDKKLSAFDTFIRNRFGVGALRWLPKEMVSKIRHTLIAMQKEKSCR